MTEFSEEWLAEHQAKMARLRRESPRLMPDHIAFSIPMLLPITPNERKHWAAKLKDKRLITARVALATVQWRNVEPLERARVTVTRYSVGAKRPDRDNLYSSCKFLLDCLCVRSKTHPNGLGFIADDDDDHLELLCRAARAPSKQQQRTEVLIQRNEA